MWILWLLVIALGLIYIYSNYKTDEEDMLGLKLVGYYFLGGFHLNLEALPIPLGIIIYLFAFKPTSNIDAKKYSACFGFAGFVIGIISRFIFM